MKQTRKITKAKFKKALFKSGGVILRTATELQCARVYLYEWINKNKEFAEPLIKEARTRIVDLAEEGLLKHLENKAPWAIRMALYTQGKHFGYTEKQEVEHSGLEKIKIEFEEPETEEE